MISNNPILVVSTNNITGKPLLNQAFFNYPGIKSVQVDNAKSNRYIIDLHNEFIDTAAMVVNVSENVFVFNIEALITLITRQVIENIEVFGVTSSSGKVEMSDVFNTIIPKTRISGKNYFAQMHQLEKDAFIQWDIVKDVPGILLLNQNDEPFAIWAGEIKYEKCPTIDVEACYNYAVAKRNAFIEQQQQQAV